MSNWTNQFEANLEDLKSKDQLRFLGDKIIPPNQINLASNDYLGLLTDQYFVNNFVPRETKCGSAASRLLCGYHGLHLDFEKFVEDETGKSCILLNSGYHANTGIIDALCKQNCTLILADRLVHASIIDGIKLSKATFRRFSHQDYDELEAMVQLSVVDYSKILIVAEALYSMDGDRCNLDALISIKNRYPNQVLLYIDEAHSVGVFGKSGLGLTDQEKYQNQVDIVVAPCGKALAGQGCLVLTSPLIKEYMINNCKTLIFSTAMPEILVSWLWYVLENISTSYLIEKRTSLLEKSAKLRSMLTADNIPYIGSDYIISTIHKSNKSVFSKIEFLKKMQINASLIRPPTVPNGTSRVRFSMHANLSNKEIEQISSAILEICSRNYIS